MDIKILLLLNFMAIRNIDIDLYINDLSLGIIKKGNISNGLDIKLCRLLSSMNIINTYVQSLIFPRVTLGTGYMCLLYAIAQYRQSDIDMKVFVDNLLQEYNNFITNNINYDILYSIWCDYQPVPLLHDPDSRKIFNKLVFQRDVQSTAINLSKGTEDIHIYIFANILNRCIIVYGDVMIPFINTNIGVYIPNLNPLDYDVNSYPLIIIFEASPTGMGHYSSVIVPNSTYIVPLEIGNKYKLPIKYNCTSSIYHNYFNITEISSIQFVKLTSDENINKIENILSSTSIIQSSTKLDHDTVEIYLNNLNLLLQEINTYSVNKYNKSYKDHVVEFMNTDVIDALLVEDNEYFNIKYHDINNLIVDILYLFLSTSSSISLYEVNDYITSKVSLFADEKQYPYEVTDEITMDRISYYITQYIYDDGEYSLLIDNMDKLDVSKKIVTQMYILYEMYKTISTISDTENYNNFINTFVYPLILKEYVSNYITEILDEYINNLDGINKINDIISGGTYDNKILQIKTDMITSMNDMITTFRTKINTLHSTYKDYNIDDLEKYIQPNNIKKLFDVFYSSPAYVIPSTTTSIQPTILSTTTSIQPTILSTTTSIQPTILSIQPITTSTQPITTSTQSTTSTQPTTTSTQPTTIQPTTTTTQPTTTIQPTTIIQPTTTYNQPITLSTQPIASLRQLYSTSAIPPYNPSSTRFLTSQSSTSPGQYTNLQGQSSSTLFS